MLILSLLRRTEPFERWKAPSKRLGTCPGGASADCVCYGEMHAHHRMQRIGWRSSDIRCCLGQLGNRAMPAAKFERFSKQLACVLHKGSRGWWVKRLQPVRSPYASGFWGPSWLRHLLPAGVLAATMAYCSRLFGEPIRAESLMMQE
jgi:hypothetical protein